MKEAIAVLALVALVVGAVAGVSIGGYYLYAFLAPKYESTRRDVMIESRYYSEASVRELYRLKREYESASTPEARQTIALAARHEFSIFPADRLPPDLRAWMAQVGR